MMCNYDLEDLVSYIENSISKEEKKEISNHLKKCNTCRKNYMALKLADNFMYKKVKSTEDFYYNLCKHIDSNRYSSSSKYNMYRNFNKILLKARGASRSAIAIVSVSVLVVTSMFMFSRFSEKTFVPGSTNDEILNTDEAKYIKEATEINSGVELPEDYTIYKIKNALLEYINYRLWLYPSIGYYSGANIFDNYINKVVDVEIRLYNNLVYAHTNIGEGLIVFKDKDGFIYADGQISEGDNVWPKDKNYELVEEFSVQIPEPHKPNYGTSKRKDMMIAEAKSVVISSCEEYYQYSDKWENLDVYIMDFFEYEMGTNALICKNDNSILVFPIHFIEEKDKIEVQTSKSFTIDNLDEQDEFTRYQYGKQIDDAVMNFKCNVNE